MFFETAERLKVSKTLIFGKIDASRNEVRYISELISQYPSIKIFSSGKKSIFYDYEGETNVQDFIRWIKSYVSFPLEENLKNDL